MNDNIVRETIPELKILSKVALKDNWLKVTMGVFLYVLVSSVVPSILALFSPGVEVPVPAENGELLNYQVPYINILYTVFILGAISLGLAVFQLSFLRKRDINPSYIFSGFEFYFKATGLYLVELLFVTLWSFLFVIPGFIALYKYSMAFYILADDPQKGIMQCIRESKEMMKGNKAKLFLLELSFIGWFLLASIPASAYASNFSINKAIGLGSADLNMTNPVVTIIFITLLMIPVYFVSSYTYTAKTIFYEIASGHLVARQRQQR